MKLVASAYGGSNNHNVKTLGEDSAMIASVRSMAVVVALALLVSGCAMQAQRLVGGDLRVDSAWARAATTADHPVAVYMRIVNSGAAADRLVGAASTAAGAVVLHRTYHADAVRMMRVSSIEIPAGGSVTLAPNGLHVTLESPTRLLRQGDSVTVTLSFARAGDISVSVRVLAPGASGP